MELSKRGWEGSLTMLWVNERSEVIQCWSLSVVVVVVVVVVGMLPNPSIAV